MVCGDLSMVHCFVIYTVTYVCFTEPKIFPRLSLMIIVERDHGHKIGLQHLINLSNSKIFSLVQESTTLMKNGRLLEQRARTMAGCDCSVNRRYFILINWLKIQNLFLKWRKP